MQEAQQKTENQVVDLPTYHDDIDDMNEASFARSRGPWWKQRRWIITISAVLLIIIIAGILFAVFSRSSKAATNYQFSQITQGNLQLTAVATGTLEGNVYNVDFPVTGTIAEIDVKLGQQVQAGQILGKLNTTTLSDSDKLGAVLKAPYAGIVTAINGSVGTLTSTIANTTNSFIQIADPSSVYATVNVNEADMGYLASGDPVSFTVDAYTNRTFTGTVSTTLPAPATISNVVTYPVLVNLNTTSFQGANLLPGMTINATILTLNHSGVLLVPVSAVSSAQKAVSQGLITSQQVQQAMATARQMLNTYMQSNGSSALQNEAHATYVLEQVNNSWVLKPVVLGVTDGTSYQVLAGLTANDNVLSGGVGGTSSSSSSSTPRFFGGGGFGGGGTGAGRG